MLLGIDTGGTFTDAVLYDESANLVVAKAKSPTTHHQLSIGISGAIDAVLRAAAVDVADIELVSLSTTLATNALVEGKGRPVCAVIIGFDGEVLERAGLGEALGADPAIILPGGHDPHGNPIAEVDESLLAREVQSVAADVAAFAITAQFSVRNSAHELAAARVIRGVTTKPVTLSHHLSSRLNGPKRAVTAVLNARLVAIIDGLVQTTGDTLRAHGIDAPLMVVRGDGSLVSAEFVKERPIETILSGPAASLVGAAHLTGVADALVADIGGTTTDIAELRGGLPIVSPEGASVGGHQTMVSAVAMRTHGLGGDSLVRHDERSAGAVAHIGPRRVVPLCQLAVEQSAVVHEMLDVQLAAAMPADLDGLVVIARDRGEAMQSLAGAEQAVLQAMSADVSPAATAAPSAQLRRALERLVQRDVVQLAGFTPTDAAHVLGIDTRYDTAAATKAATLFARRRDRLGRPLATSAPAVAQTVIGALVRRSAEAVLSAAFVSDGLAPETVKQQVVQVALDRGLRSASAVVGLGLPLVALGASAPAYYPMVADLLGASVQIPADADVANAIGAVVGSVRLSRVCHVSSPHAGSYLVHHPDGSPERFGDLAEARAGAHTHLRKLVAADMVAAGAPTFEINERWSQQVVDIGGADLFVEASLTITATGRPRRAH